jgi:excinuclease UvrABC ATPase subunit
MNYTKQQVIIDLDEYNALKTQEKNLRIRQVILEMKTTEMCLDCMRSGYDQLKHKCITCNGRGENEIFGHDDYLNTQTTQLQKEVISLIKKHARWSLPTDSEVGEWYDLNIDSETSASSAIYKFRLWLKEQLTP